MAKKNNIRSIRFSDDVLEIIEAQEGETFTAKFESLIRTCYQELPEKERQIKNYDMAIKERREQLGRMTIKTEAYRKQLFSMESSLKQLSINIAKAQELEW